MEIVLIAIAAYFLGIATIAPRYYKLLSKYHKLTNRDERGRFKKG